MEDIFQKIENNFYESQDKKINNADQETKYNQGETTDESLNIIKLVNPKPVPKTEMKMNLNMFKDVKIPNPIETEQKKLEDDEYSDYGRRNKQGIHFQIISEHNVSIEIVPEDIITSEIESLLDKYKAVFDPSMKLWILPYVNYMPLYMDLMVIKDFKYKIYKVGSIAKKCYENKTLSILKIQRKAKEEKIDYTKDNKERDVDTLPKSIKNTLYDFQIEGIKFGIEHHCRFLLADEMGVGKTIQAISLCYLYREDWPVLIVCPGSMKYLWKGEIQTWLGFKDKRINILNSSKQKISDEAYFYIISYDLVSHILKKLKKMNFNFVILDEAHCIKNRETIRAKNILPIAIRAKRLILMTGTPLLAKPLEGYPLLYALRPDIFPFFKQYAYRYCDPQPTPFGISWSGTSNTKELHWLLSTLMVRRLKKEVLNKLPPKRRQKVEIKTDPEILEKIKEARVKVKGRNGTLLAYTLTSTAKKDGVCEYVSDILTDSDEKIIVFAYHHEMMNSVESLLKEKNVDYIRIDGSTKQDKRYDYVRYFQQKQDCRVAIVSIIAGSTGITLNKAHIVIFAELTWTPSIMIQAEDRAHRIGQKSNFVDIKYLYGPGTLDDFILDKLQKKLVIVSTTIDDKRENFGVQADPNLIYVGGGSKPKNSQELMKIAKGDLFSEMNSDSDSEEEGNNEKKMEKKMMQELLEHDPELQFVNTGLSSKKNEEGNKKVNPFEDFGNFDDNDLNLNLKALHNISSNDNNNEKSDSDDNDSKDSLEAYFEDLDKIINNNNNVDEQNNNNNKLDLDNDVIEAIRKVNNDQENHEQDRNEKILLNDDFFKLADDNIKEEVNNKKRLSTETKLYKNINDSNSKPIQYPKKDKKSIKSIINNNKKYRYPKNDFDDDYEDDISDVKKYLKNNKNKKVKYPKNEKERRKTPDSSGFRRHKKLSGAKKKEKRWNSIDKKNEISSDTEKPKKEISEKINIKDLFKDFENDLMINLHKENMRRSTSQMETKQSQSSIINEENNNKKYNTQTNRFLFVNDKDKNIFNENYDEINNDKVKLQFN